MGQESHTKERGKVLQRSQLHDPESFMQNLEKLSPYNRVELDILRFSQKFSGDHPIQAFFQ
jgi:hypothetical protein